MGTDIVSYNGISLYWISVVFALNVFLFGVFLIISILRYTIYPQIWFAMIRHPAQSLFLGTFPMGLATIVNMVVFVCVPAWGTWAVYLVSDATATIGATIGRSQAAVIVESWVL
jgi:tellurite resistance protein TehA-like permease